MRIRRPTRILAAILAGVMVMHLIPAQAFAETLQTEQATEYETENDVSILGEVEELREDDTKHFALTDGSYIAVSYGMPVHYSDEEGKWQDIDNSLSLESASGTYQLNRSDAAVMFSGSLSDGTLLTTSKDGTSISVSLLDTSDAMQMIIGDPATEVMDSGEQQEAQSELPSEPISVNATPELAMNEAVAGDTMPADDTSLEISAEETAMGENPETVPTQSEESSVPPEAAEPMIDDGEITADENAEMIASEEGISYSRTATAQIASDVPSMLNLQENYSWSIEDVIPENLQSSLIYEDVFPDVDLMYTAFGYNIKEQIIVYSAQEEYRYDFLLELDGLTATMNSDGSVSFANDNGVVIYSIPTPYMEDGNGIISEAVEYTLTNTAQGIVLTVEADSGWINAEDRVFPIKIDPTFTISSGSALDDIYSVYTMEAAPNDVTLGRQWLYVGAQPYSTTNDGRYRTFMHFNAMPTIPKGSEVVEARLSLYQTAYNQRYCTQLPIGVYEVTTSLPSSYSSYYNWFAAMTWNTHMPSYDTTNAIDFVMADSTGGYRTWNITELVKKWYTEGTSNTTAALVMMNEDAIDTYYYYASATFYAYAGSVPPVLIVAYRNTNGLENYWSYTTTSAGRAGTGYVNQYTGNLVWVHDDIGFGGNLMPVSIKHVYNSNDENDNSRGLGYGWRTNYGQIVRCVVDSGEDEYYIWEDADGTAHCFMLESGSTYKDEDGLELTFTSGGATDERKYTITDKYGNISYFDVSGRLREQINNQETASSITITYTTATGRYISTITDGAGRKYNFTYTNGMLTKISYVGTDTEEDSFVSFGYTGTNLTSITYADGKTTTFAYSGNRLISAQDVDGYKLAYTYTNGSHKRIASIKEYDGSIEGGTLNLEYAHNQTTLKDHNGNVQIVQFNNWGNAIAVQDDQGRAEYTRYALNGNDEDVYTNTTKPNQLTLSSKMQNTVGNVLNDSSFEHGTLWNAIFADRTTRSITTEEAYLGSKSLKMVHTADGLSSGVNAPAFTVKPGETYTFSAYLKTVESNAYLCMSDGSVWLTSDYLPENSDWTRMQMSYTNTGTSDKSVTVRVQTGKAGTTYIDCAQVEKALTASRYNLVENGDFRHTNIWSASAGRTTLSDVAAPELSTNVYKMAGTPASVNRLSQTVYVSGNAGDTLVLAGWALGNSAPLHDHDGDGTALGDTEFAVLATVNYTNGGSKTFKAQFNPSMNGTEKWQYSCAPIVPEYAYSSVTVELAYDYNANTAYFDGIQLYREEFGSSYTYDEDGNVVSVRDLQSQLTEYEFDEETHDLTKAVLPSGLVLTYGYDDYHNVTTATSSTGLVYSFQYDTYGNNTAISIRDKENTSPSLSSSAEYTEDGNRLVSTTDAAGNVTAYGYDEQTNVLNWVQYPKDSEATRTTYTYDDMYRLAEANMAVRTDQVLSANYTYANDLLTKVTTGSTTYDFNYGAFSLRSNIKISERTLATYNYTTDRNYYLSSLDYGNGDRVQYTYDDLGRVTKQTYEDGDTFTYEYDNSGALATVTDSATGIATTYYYDFTDRLMKYVEKGAGYSHSVGYGYDSLNNLTALVDTINGTAHTTEYTYDDDNRVTSVANGSVGKSYAYDDYSRVSQRVTKNGDTTVLTENLSYREYEVTIDGETTDRTSGQVSSLTIDAAEDITYSYTYDGNGNILSVSDGTYTTSYVYDAANQLIRENNQAAETTWVWTYDNAGNILSREEYPYSTSKLSAYPNTVSYTYDATWGDLLTGYDGTTITSDTIGNMLTDGTWTYNWEHGRQLASMTGNNVGNAEAENEISITYAYDSDGLRTRKAVTTNIYHEHTYNETVVAPTCTEAGYTIYTCTICSYSFQESSGYGLGHSFENLTCTRCGFKLPGILLPTLPNNSPGTGTSDADNSDGAEATVQEEETVIISEESTESTASSDTSERIPQSVIATEYAYVYTGDKLAQMTVTTQVDDETPTVETLYFAYDASGLPMAVTYGTNTYYYVTNLQGDVVALLDNTGAKVALYSYDAWGNPLPNDDATGSAIEQLNPLRYRAYVYDNETGLYYLQSRYYDPEMGRFINADAFTSTGQGLLGNNMFTYCNNNPVCNNDPSGFWSVASGIANPNAMVYQSGEYMGWIIPDIERKSQEEAARARQAMSPFNTDEQIVLDAEHFAFYKGKMVIKGNFYDNSAFSCGIIFMDYGINDPNLLRHEFGHTQQLSQVGIFYYLFYVVLPSTTCFWLTQSDVLPDELYYSLPWEYKANEFGQAVGTYAPWASTAANIYWAYVWTGAQLTAN